MASEPWGLSRLLALTAFFVWLLIPAELFFWIIVLVPPFESHSETAIGLVGSTAALTAAWTAWVAVNRQILADDERAQRQKIEDRAADADTISALLLLGATTLARFPRRGIDRYIAPTCLGMLRDAMRIDTRLGTALGAFIREAEAHEIELQNAIQTGSGRIVDLSKGLALRARLLADAMQVASRSLGSTGMVPDTPLLNRESLQSRPGEAQITDGSIGWASLLLGPKD